MERPGILQSGIPATLLARDRNEYATGAGGMVAIRDAVLNNVAPLPSTHRIVRPALNGCRSRSTVCPPVASEVSSYEGKEAGVEAQGWVCTYSDTVSASNQKSVK